MNFAVQCTVFRLFFELLFNVSFIEIVKMDESAIYRSDVIWCEVPCYFSLTLYMLILCNSSLWDKFLCLQEMVVRSSIFSRLWVGGARYVCL